MKTSGSKPLFGAEAAALGQRIVRESIAFDTARVVRAPGGQWTEPVIARWMITPNAHLGGSTPIDVLRANNLSEVLNAAARTIEMGEEYDAPMRPASSSDGSP
jgi:hypothetical protein